ncbi:hypothetical protein [Vibrio phage BUCT233]|uniref:Uncharacterized protein n=1 Tax=Vibrio phage BUCT233 TaxID=2834267 RepID=A0A8E8U3Y1_9CAUD|nr:hypothetical protein [Vibrio phage BUCT233]
MSKLKRWFNRHSERILFIAVGTGMVAVIVVIGWGVKALELMFYKWALGF